MREKGTLKLVIVDGVMTIFIWDGDEWKNEFGFNELYCLLLQR